MYMEHFVQHPRHIEFQILADEYGQCDPSGRAGLFHPEKPSEDDRGIALSRALSEELRQKMGEAAVKAAKAAGYVNAGTIEFLLEKNETFLFYGNEYQDPGGASGDRDG